jgi:hypothetical protein
MSVTTSTITPTVGLEISGMTSADVTKPDAARDAGSGISVTHFGIRAGSPSTANLARPEQTLGYGRWRGDFGDTQRPRTDSEATSMFTLRFDMRVQVAQ